MWQNVKFQKGGLIKVLWGFKRERSNKLPFGKEKSLHEEISIWTETWNTLRGMADKKKTLPGTGVGKEKAS
jgi:hypothetical protein